MNKIENRIKVLQKRRDKVNKEIKELRKELNEEQKNNKIKYTELVILRGELLMEPLKFVKKFKLKTFSWGTSTDKEIDSWNLIDFWNVLENSNLPSTKSGRIELLTKNVRFRRDVPIHEIGEVKFTLSHFRSKRNENVWLREKEMKSTKGRLEKMGFNCWFEIKKLENNAQDLKME
jgi:hypothetical protein